VHIKKGAVLIIASEGLDGRIRERSAGAFLARMGRGGFAEVKRRKERGIRRHIINKSIVLTGHNRLNQ